MELVTLKTFRKKYNHSINKGLSMYRFDEWLTKKYGVTLDFDVYLSTYDTYLQRPLVWTESQKEQLILSILRDCASLKFVLVEVISEYGRKEPSTFLVLDEKQRMNTIFEFIQNKFSIPHPTTNDLIFYKDLDAQSQREITNPHLCIYDVRYSYPDQRISDDTLIDIFEDVNFLGTPQDVNHFVNIKKKQNEKSEV